MAFSSVRAGHDFIVAFLSAGMAVQVDDDEVLFDRAGVESPEVAFERFAQGQRLFHDHPDFVFDLLFDSGMLAKRLSEGFLEECFHQSEKTSEKVNHSVSPS